MDIIPILRDFGFPIALCCLLLWAIRHMAAQLVKAYTDRIGTLERIVSAQGKRIEELEADRLRRSDEYAHSIKDAAMRFGEQAREFTRTIREIMPILKQLVEAIGGRPCMVDRDYRPHQTPRPPSVHDLPADPPSDRIRNG